MIDIIVDTVLDTLKLALFLYLTFFVIELIEHKLQSTKKLSKVGKFGPIIGSFLGAFPQCGFSVSATNFYITRIITLGTLVSVYLSTSDEMLPIMIAQNVDIKIILEVIGIKIILGMFFGFLIDFFYRKKEKLEIKHLCEEEDCHCDENLFLSALIHTLSTVFFIFIISFIINVVMEYYGQDLLSKIFLKESFFSPFLSSLVGLIPNCGASVMLTQLFINNSITFGSMLGGLLTGSGVGLLVLFKNNKNLKENIMIMMLIYFIGVVSGIVLNFFC